MKREPHYLDAYREQFFNNLWRWKLGLPEYNITIGVGNNIGESKPQMSLAELKRTEWSPEFERLMRHRLIFGAYRYGRMGHGRVPEGKPKYDRCESIRKRLEFFEDTGNAEWLIDIANLALLLFEEQMHPKFHFKHIDGDTDESYHDNILK